MSPKADESIYDLVASKLNSKGQLSLDFEQTLMLLNWLRSVDETLGEYARLIIELQTLVRTEKQRSAQSPHIKTEGAPGQEGVLVSEASTLRGTNLPKGEI